MTLYWKDTNGRNWPVCACLKAWLPAYQNELLRVGVIKHGLDAWQTIGGAAASGGTHATGQCVDTAQFSTKAIWVARQMGADASWHRPYNWDNRKGIAHAHLNLRGCPHGTAAADRQYSSTFSGVDHGKNGLANGAKDPGPRPLSKRTWKQGIAWAKAQQPQEDEMPAPKDLWNWDGIPVQEPAATAASIKKNPTWSPKSVLTTMLREQAKQTQAIDALAKAVQKLANGGTNPKA